jgi:hypothetical protein
MNYTFSFAVMNTVMIQDQDAQKSSNEDTNEAMRKQEIAV